MKNQIALLIDLQKIDQDIRTLSTKKQTLPDAARELDRSIETRRDRMAEERIAFESLNKLHKEKELEFKQGQEKLRKARERLQEVKTNREYQAMLMEIETVEQGNGRIEEDILVLYDRIDEKKVFLEVHEKAFEKDRIMYEEERKRIDEEMVSLDGDLEEQKEKFDTLLQGLEPDLRRRYEMIKGRLNGIAIVPARKGICSGCNMNIPPQLYNELQRSDQIHYCPNCNRIIYRDENANGG